MFILTPHTANFIRERISFTEVTVFWLYRKLSEHNSCTQFYLINSLLHSNFTFSILKKFAVWGLGQFKHRDTRNMDTFISTESEVSTLKRCRHLLCFIYTWWKTLPTHLKQCGTFLAFPVMYSSKDQSNKVFKKYLLTLLYTGVGVILTPT